MALCTIGHMSDETRASTPLPEPEPPKRRIFEILKRIVEWKVIIVALIGVGAMVTTYSSSLVKHTDLKRAMDDSKAAVGIVAGDVQALDKRTVSVERGLTDLHDDLHDVKETLNAMNAQLNAQLIEISRTVGARVVTPTKKGKP